MEVFRAAVALVVRSMVVSAQSAGQQRLLWLQQSATVGGEVGELVVVSQNSSGDEFGRFTGGPALCYG